MAKRYLNKEERESLYLLVGFKVFLDERIKLWQTLETAKKLLRPARTARTWLHKLIGEILCNLDINEQASLLKHSSNVRMVARTKEEAIRELNKLKKDEHYILTPDEFHNFMELALKPCSTCRLKQYKACPSRELFMKYDIAPINTGNGCQYKY